MEKTGSNLPKEEQALATARAWVESVVIGLNLCPFARPAFENGTLRMTVSQARTPETLMTDTLDELLLIASSADTQISTSIVVAPYVLSDFDDYLDFTGAVQAAIVETGNEGIIQLATFHPDYVFAGTAPDDVANATNRAPYPLLHFLREDQVTQAVESHSDTLQIPERNVALMRELGAKHMSDLLKECGSRDGLKTDAPSS
jgi:hypothetical protein